MNEFRNVNDSHRITSEFKFDDAFRPRLIRFEGFYQKLRLILSRKPSSEDQQGKPVDATPPPQTVMPTTSVSPTTPPPSTNSVDPQYSSTSNVTVSSKAESTDEHFTQSLANVFIYASYQSLKKSLSSIAWYRETNYELQHRCPAEMVPG